MALVKKSSSSVQQKSVDSVSASPVASTRDAEALRKRARTLAKQQQAAERLASATGQLSSGIAEASSAAEELKRSSDQIATGAEEASSAAQQSLRAVQQVAEGVNRQRAAAKIAQNRAEGMRGLADRTGKEVTATVENVNLAARRQLASVQMVGELEKQAANIGDIVKAVARIADQTNLLALNAAIEAARAGKHGKGFAVVADEVRTLAETSEKSARDIQDMVAQIQNEVKTISEGINTAAGQVQAEAEKGKVILSQLGRIREDANVVVEGALEIATAAEQSATAATQALQGSEAIAAAAEEQS